MIKNREPINTQFKYQTVTVRETCQGNQTINQIANQLRVNFSKNATIGIKVGFIVITVAIMLVSSISQTQAYSWSGCKWPTNNPVYDGHTLTSGWNTAVSNGRNQWNNVTPSSLTIYRNDTSNNDVTLGYTAGLIGTTTRTCNSGTITNADIVFNSSFSWYTGTGSPGSSWDAWSTATHEFGHYLGFGHAQAAICGGSESTKPTMCNGYSAGKTYKRSLEYDDRNGLNVIY